jgi:hypothetical protein
MSLGFTGFPVVSFWTALYFQEVLGFSALSTGVHMLPMVVAGLLVNVSSSSPMLETSFYAHELTRF